MREMAARNGDEHLAETSSSISKYDATLEDQMKDVQQQLKSQEQQFLKQEQQFLKQEQQFLNIDVRFDQLINILSTKQPSMLPSEDLKTMMEQLLQKQSESFISSLNDHKKTSAEEAKKNSDDLKAHVQEEVKNLNDKVQIEISKGHEDLKADVDEKFASMSHDVKKTFESQARQIASIEEAQHRQEQAIAAFTTFAKDIGAAKLGVSDQGQTLQATDGVNDDISWESSQSPANKPANLHETYLANRRKGFSSTPFVPTSRVTRPSFGATRIIFKPTDSTENKAGTTTMVNDPSYVAVSQPVSYTHLTLPTKRIV